MRPRRLRALEFANVYELAHRLHQVVVNLDRLLFGRDKHLEEGEVTIVEDKSRYAESAVLIYRLGVAIGQLPQQVGIGDVLAEAGHVNPRGVAGGVNYDLIVKIGLVLVTCFQEGHKVGFEGLLALPLDCQSSLMGQEDGVVAIDDVGPLPDVVAVLVIDLRQREGLPVNLDGLSRQFPNLCQPHVGIVDKGSTKIVKSGELSLGHLMPPAGVAAQISLDGAGQLAVNCSHVLSGCQRGTGRGIDTASGTLGEWPERSL